MANDVSYFKVPGDSTTYSFNDADAENKIGALETTVADQADSIAANATNIQTNRTAIGTLSSLTTDAQGNLVAAVNEVDSHADTNASAISTINTAIGSTALPTTAQTITGAIAEHETDITSLNSNLSNKLQHTANSATSFAFSLPNWSNGNYYYFLMFGGNGATSQFLYVGWINADGSSVALNAIKAASMTLSATFNASTKIITITATSTVWGGMSIVAC